MIKYVAKLGTSPPDRPAIAQAHALFVAAESIQSAHRAMTRFLRNVQSPGDKAVSWHFFFNAAGSVAELRARLTRHRALDPIIRKHLTENKPNLLPVLDRVAARQISGDLPLQLCCFARQHFTGFWNESVSTQFADSLKLDGSDSPVITTTDDGRNSRTGVPWVKESWTLAWKREFSLSDRQLKDALRDIRLLCRDAAKLGRYAAIGVLLSTGVRLERREDAPGESSGSGVQVEADASHQPDAAP